MLKYIWNAEAAMLITVCFVGQWVAYALAALTLPGYTWEIAVDMARVLWFEPLVLFVVLLSAYSLRSYLETRRSTETSSGLSTSCSS